MSKKTTFLGLPEALRELVVQLAITRARQDPTISLVDAAGEAMAAGNAVFNYGKADQVKSVNTFAGVTIPVAPDSEETATLKIGQLKSSTDSANPEDGAVAESLLEVFLRDLRKEHCGNPNCVSCNTRFGKADQPEPVKPEATFVKSIVDGDRIITVLRSDKDDSLYIISDGVKTLVTYNSASDWVLPDGFTIHMLNKFGK